MNKKALILVLLSLHLIYGLKLTHLQSSSLVAGKVNLLSDNGKYLARCNNCGPAAYPDSATIHETNPSNPWAIWTI